METIYSILDLTIDLLFCLPPFGDLPEWRMPPHAAEFICFAAVALLAIVWVGRALLESQFFPDHPLLGWTVTIVVILLAFGSISRAEWSAIFSTAYVALILALRVMEGAVLGDMLGRKPAWLLIAIIVFIVGLAGYLVLSAVPRTMMVAIKTGWLLVTAVIASVGFASRAKAAFPGTELNHGLVALALCLLFLSTTLYVATSKTLAAAYTMTCPIGLVTAFVISMRARKRQRAVVPTGS